MGTGFFYSVVLLLLMACLLQYSTGLKTINLLQGTNATIPFHHELKSDDTTFTYELFEMSKTRPFSTNGQVQPEYRGHYNVSHQRKAKDLIISLHIVEVTAGMDDEIFIVNIREDDSGKFSAHIYDIHIDVTVPPGKARCTMKFTSDDLKVSEIFCQATTEGHAITIICYDDMVKAVQRSMVSNETDTMATFWLKSTSPVLCCSSDNNAEKSPSSCSDFTYDPPGRFSSTPRPHISFPGHTITHISFPGHTMTTTDSTTSKCSSSNATLFHTFVSAVLAKIAKNCLAQF